MLTDIASAFGKDRRAKHLGALFDKHEKLARAGVSRTAGDYVSLDGDGDVWVERHFKCKSARIKSYFRSVRTDDCVWHEPPTGASYTVFLTELEQYPFLREFALGPLGKPTWTIEPRRRTASPQKKGLFA